MSRKFRVVVSTVSGTNDARDGSRWTLRQRFGILASGILAFIIVAIVLVLALLLGSILALVLCVAIAVALVVLYLKRTRKRHRSFENATLESKTEAQRRNAS